jgi:preprotein translocase subunit SecD
MKKIVITIIVIFVAICFTNAQAGVKFIGPKDTFDITKDDVKSVRGAPDSFGKYMLIIEFSKEGAKRFYRMTEKNEGNYISIYYGDTLLQPDTFLPEPMYTKEFPITLDDEKMMREIIRFYQP